MTGAALASGPQRPWPSSGGAIVIGCDISLERSDELADALSRTSLGSRLVQADVTQQGDIDRLVREALGECGRIDVVANIAGIMDRYLPAHAVDDTTWALVLDVNLSRPMRLCRAALPGMLDRRHGAIVNVLSVAGARRGGRRGIHRVEARGHRADEVDRMDLRPSRHPLQRRSPRARGNGHREHVAACSWLGA